MNEFSIHFTMPEEQEYFHLLVPDVGYSNQVLTQTTPRLKLLTLHVGSFLGMLADLQVVQLLALGSCGLLQEVTNFLIVDLHVAGNQGREGSKVIEESK